MCRIAIGKSACNNPVLLTKTALIQIRGDEWGHHGAAAQPYKHTYCEIGIKTMDDTVNSFCELCHSPIEVSGFDLCTKEGERHFCCEGCQGIYRMLHEEEVIDVPSSSKEK